MQQHASGSSQTVLALASCMTQHTPPAVAKSVRALAPCMTQQHITGSSLNCAWLVSLFVGETTNNILALCNS